MSQTQDAVERPLADRPLAGRHAVVTGASRGIGAAIARELARIGCDLTLVARSHAPLGKLAEELHDLGVRVTPVTADLTQEDAIAAALAQAAAKLGDPAILVNNAGGAETAPLARTDRAMLERAMALNLTSAFLTTRAVVPAMVKAGWGRVVNVGSTAGLKGYAYVTAYVAAKHAVVGFTRAAALELAKTGVTVNAVCPGYTDTPMLDTSIAAVAAKTHRARDDIRAEFAAANPMARLIKPEEVAAAVGWLCRPEAASITGVALPVAGGEV
jgi:NAD(P)-dependent dehydrogenase (short-subunit alcohol dehydrogenase family)